MSAKKKAARKQKRVVKKETHARKHPKVARFKAKVKNAIKNGSHPRNIPYAHLIPFKKMMVKQLDKKGITHSTEISDVSKKFLNHIVRKLNVPNRFDFSSIGKDSETFNLVEEVAEGIVRAIISFIRGLMKKKNEGEPLPQDEKEMIDDAEKGIEEASEANEEDERSESWFSKLLDKIFPARVSRNK